jgi:hypothetical protein
MTKQLSYFPGFVIMVYVRRLQKELVTHPASTVLVEKHVDVSFWGNPINPQPMTSSFYPRALTSVSLLQLQLLILARLA